MPKKVKHDLKPFTFVSEERKYREILLYILMFSSMEESFFFFFKVINFKIKDKGESESKKVILLMMLLQISKNLLIEWKDLKKINEKYLILYR